MNDSVMNAPDGAANLARSSDAYTDGDRARRLQSVARVLRREAGDNRKRAAFMEKHAHLLDRRARALIDRIWASRRRAGDDSREDSSNTETTGKRRPLLHFCRGNGGAANGNESVRGEQAEKRGPVTVLRSGARRFGQKALVATAAFGSAVSAAATHALHRIYP